MESVVNLHQETGVSFFLFKNFNSHSRSSSRFFISLGIAKYVLTNLNIIDNFRFVIIMLIDPQIVLSYTFRSLFTLTSEAFYSGILIVFLNCGLKDVLDLFH